MIVTRFDHAGDSTWKNRATAAFSSRIRAGCWLGWPAWLSKSPHPALSTRSPRLALTSRAITSISATSGMSDMSSSAG